MPKRIVVKEIYSAKKVSDFKKVIYPKKYSEFLKVFQTSFHNWESSVIGFSVLNPRPFGYPAAAVFINVSGTAIVLQTNDEDFFDEDEITENLTDQFKYFFHRKIFVVSEEFSESSSVLFRLFTKEWSTPDKKGFDLKIVGSSVFNYNKKNEPLTVFGSNTTLQLEMARFYGIVLPREMEQNFEKIENLERNSELTPDHYLLAIQKTYLKLILFIRVLREKFCHNMGPGINFHFKFNPRNYCFICSGVVQDAQFHTHMEVKHRIYTCFSCHAIFSTKNDLNKHIRSYHE